MSLRLTLLNVFLRRVARPRLIRTPYPETARRDFERMSRYLLAGARGVAVTHAPGLGQGPDFVWFTPPDAGEQTVIYFHGGGYIAGSPRTHRGLTASFARATGLRLCAPRYRLAPEHPFPAAWNDAHAAWTRLLATGLRPQDIVLAGDSAGGGLALSLLARLCAAGTPPAAAIVFSPWTDMAGSGDSYRRNAATDPLLPVERVAELAAYALGGHDPRDPVASPLFADFPNCPPVFFAVSDTEILQDDSAVLCARLRAEGATAVLHICPRCPHAWPIFTGRLPEADGTIRAAAAFLRRVWPSVGTARSDGS